MTNTNPAVALLGELRDAIAVRVDYFASEDPRLTVDRKVVAREFRAVLKLFDELLAREPASAGAGSVAVPDSVVSWAARTVAAGKAQPTEEGNFYVAEWVLVQPRSSAQPAAAPERDAEVAGLGKTSFVNQMFAESPNETTLRDKLNELIALHNATATSLLSLWESHNRALAAIERGLAGKEGQNAPPR